MRCLRVIVQPPGAAEPDHPVEVVLPLRLNRLVACVWHGGRLRVECSQPHGLWNADGTFLNAAACEDGVLLICGRNADTHVDPASLIYVSPTKFEVRCHHDGANDGARYLHLPTIASPARLCAQLTDAARGALPSLRLAFCYDPMTDRVELTATTGAPGTRVRLLPCQLAHVLGISTAVVLLENGETVWPCESTHLWDYAQIHPGFYAPCHRPMCTGSPLRFGSEIETAVNRFYFPMQSAADSSVPPHTLFFTDPYGTVRSCAILPGRYTPATLCAYLEDSMTAAARRDTCGKGVAFSVSQDDMHRFVFACEDDGAPAPFALHWHHPHGVDPDRFGFAAQPLAGDATYVAPRATRIPRADLTTSRVVSNLVRVSEVAAQKRFRIHTVTPPTMVVEVCAPGDASTPNAITLRAYVGERPYAHGFQSGDVLRLGAVPPEGVTVRPAADSAPRALRASTAEFPASGCAVVVLPAHTSDPPDVLRVHPPQRAGVDEVGTALTLTARAEPWNVCFCKPHSLPAHLVGFPRAAVQWGVDGSVGDAHGRLLPPFEAPYSHCLDHPDYVLLTFSEASGANFEHAHGGQIRSIFCKLSLYPLFREERMLPRDTDLMRGNMSRFTVAFWNPDWTPYRFHGAEFSFSLNFFSPVP